jgi:hypothetical protein
MRDFLRTARPVAAALFVTFALVACDGDDEVGDGFSAQTAEEMAGVADEVTEASESSQQVQANLVNAFSAMLAGGGGALSPVLPFEMMARARATSLRDFTTTRVSASMAAPSAPNGVLLPDAMEGITFVWDVADSMYVASDLTGAPANGARFVFYAVNPFSGYPTEPLTEVGYMDLTDETTSDLARLEVLVVDEVNDRTMADYYLQGAVDSLDNFTTVTLDTEGFVRGADRLDFDMQMVFGGADGSDESELHTSVELSTDAGSITLNHDEVQSSADYEASGEFVIEGEGNEAAFGFDIVGEDELDATIEGALTWNGEEVVLMDGDAGDPDFTNADGGDLSAGEIQALAGMWYAFGATYAFAFLSLFPFLLLMAFSGF